MKIMLKSDARVEKVNEILAKFNISDSLITQDTVDKLTSLVSSPMYDAFYAIYAGIDEKASTEFLSKTIHFCVDYADEIAALCDTLESLAGKSEDGGSAIKAIEDVKAAMEKIVENKTHIENYMIISDTVANEKNPGGEVWCTADGVNWEPITRNGFNDKFNHGVRTFAIGEDGSLYFGCANPYYGAQLWKCTDLSEGAGIVDNDPQQDEGSKNIVTMIFDILRYCIDTVKTVVKIVVTKELPDLSDLPGKLSSFLDMLK